MKKFIAKKSFFILTVLMLFSIPNCSSAPGDLEYNIRRNVIYENTVYPYVYWSRS